jgi:flagellar motor protein MotB
MQVRKPASVPHAEALKRRVFFGKPYSTLGRFPKRIADVDELPKSERRKLQQTADFVVKSLGNPVLTAGVVIAVGLRGHSYDDSEQKGLRRAQEDKELSFGRAQSVADALMDLLQIAIERLGPAQTAPEELLVPMIDGVGLRAPVRNNPANEFERSLNRRVEVFLLKDFEMLGEGNRADL